MGIWFRNPDILLGERILYRAAANHLINLVEMRGGRIVVTDRRVLFEPNRLDRLTGGRPWVVESRAIRDVISESGSKQSVAKYGPAGLRPHLIFAVDGTDSGVFAVRKPDELKTAVDICRGRATS